METDYNKIAALEKAISEQYGQIAIVNPRSGWTREQEAEFQKGIKKKTRSEEETLIREIENVCPICDSYLRNVQDDLYMTKFGCCQKCYVIHIEDRESKWEEKKERLLNKNA